MCSSDLQWAGPQPPELAFLYINTTWAPPPASLGPRGPAQPSARPLGTCSPPSQTASPAAPRAALAGCAETRAPGAGNALPSPRSRHALVPPAPPVSGGAARLQFEAKRGLWTLKSTRLGPEPQEATLVSSDSASPVETKNRLAPPNFAVAMYLLRPLRIDREYLPSRVGTF